MITLTIVRHGESTDNLKACWAGWADAPLSVHGMNQAKSLGESFGSTNVDAILASDLLRAQWTAQQIQKHQPEPRPPITVTPILREQHFGIAEHKPFGKEGYIRGSGRLFKFDQGESLEDVRRRATEAIEKFIEPSLQQYRGQAPTRHLVMVAHGIFNAELLGALLARRTDDRAAWEYRGMTNTGWTRAEIGYAEEVSRVSTPTIRSDPEGPVDPSSHPIEKPPSTPMNRDVEPLDIRILCTDVTRHLDGVHRQTGGIGSQGYDDKQKDLRAFFAGKTS